MIQLEFHRFFTFREMNGSRHWASVGTDIKKVTARLVDIS